MPSLTVEEIILEYVCPGLGTLTATIMFAAPYQDVKRATSETGRLDALNPTPWAFMIGNCFGWVAYSMLIQNLFVFFANAPGFILSVWLNMAAVKLQYENHKSSVLRKSMMGALKQESIRRSSLMMQEESSLFDEQQPQQQPQQQEESELPNSMEHGDGAFGMMRVAIEVFSQHQPVPAPHERLVLGIVTFWVAIISIVAFGEAFSQGTKEIIVGIAVNCNLVFFYGAPLSTIATVLKHRESTSIHIPTMITNTANGTFWCAYGIAVFDLFIAVPNGLGALLGGVQMFLCLTFPRKQHKAQNATPAEPVEHPDETTTVELSSSTKARVLDNAEEESRKAGPKQEELDSEPTPENPNN